MSAMHFFYREPSKAELWVRGCCYAEYYRALHDEGRVPICFNYIDKKLMSSTYASFADFREDIEQVFENCGHFNSVDTLIYQDASTMHMAYGEAGEVTTFLRWRPRWRPRRFPSPCFANMGREKVAEIL